jgi:O-antigen ligase
MDRLSTISLDDFSISLRFKSWQLTWEAIKKQPIGYGIGSFNIMEILRSQQIQDIYDLPHCHNIILELFAEGGIVTILIFTVKFFQVFISNIKLHRSKIQDGSMLGATLLAVACGFMLFGMGDFPLSTPKAILVFCMILAISDTSSSLYEIKPLKTIKK